ncbi:MAG: CPBP family intramembrane glutamic endopeptidase [Thermoplasmata archaeon]
MYNKIEKEESIAIKAELFLFSIIIGEIIAFVTFYTINREDINIKSINFKPTKNPIPYIFGFGFVLIYSLIQIQIPLVREYSFTFNTLKLFSIFVAIVAGIIEETIFRGYIINYFKSKGSYSIIISSLIFSVFHITWNVFGMLGTFIIGLIFGYIYFKWNSLLPDIISHALLDSIIEPGMIISFFLI